MDVYEALDELEKLIIGFRAHIDIERVRRACPGLTEADDENLLVQFIQTNHPADVLLNCFYEYDLQDLAVKRLDIKKERNLRGRDLADVILEECCGFPTEIEPFGLYQIRECLDSDLKKAATDESLSDIEIDGICIKMAREGMEEVFPTLFCFHSWALWQKIPESKDVIKRLCDRYWRGSKSLGNYIRFEQKEKKQKAGYLTELMDLIQKAPELKNYCQEYFKCEVLLTQSHIAELGMLVTYRNLIIHDWRFNRWQEKVDDAEINLSKMDENARKNWTMNWKNVARSVSLRPQKPKFPKREMLQKMAAFFFQFLDLLSQNRIYPEVITMVSAIEKYYRCISVNSSDPNKERFFLTDCEFVPRTEHYYHPHSNHTSIDQILVSKKELEEWRT